MAVAGRGEPRRQFLAGISHRRLPIAASWPRGWHPACDASFIRRVGGFHFSQQSECEDLAEKALGRHPVRFKSRIRGGLRGAPGTDVRRGGCRHGDSRWAPEERSVIDKDPA